VRKAIWSNQLRSLTCSFFLNLKAPSIARPLIRPLSSQTRGIWTIHLANLRWPPRRSNKTRAFLRPHLRSLCQRASLTATASPLLKSEWWTTPRGLRLLGSLEWQSMEGSRILMVAVNSSSRGTQLGRRWVGLWGHCRQSVLRAATLEGFKTLAR
jgi:hypothetical protein